MFYAEHRKSLPTQSITVHEHAFNIKCSSGTETVACTIDYILASVARFQERAKAAVS